MKNIYKNILAAAVVSAASTAAVAQSLSTGYFNDGFLYRHEINPAIGNEQSYVSIPVAGNAKFGVKSNIGIDNIFYNVNGRTTTFLNGAVDAESFLSELKDKNKINQDLKIQIMGAGFKAWGGYNTIEINARENLNLSVPYSLFELAKGGLQNKDYNISDFGINARAFGEVALGHSHQINSKLRIGAKLKLLVGIGNVDAKFNNAHITLGENAYTATVNAEVQTSIKGFKYEMGSKMRGPEGNQTEHHYVHDVDIDGGGINGFGFAADLGAEYKINDQFAVSLSLLDLGTISWKNNMIASCDNTFTTDDYIFSADDESIHSFDNEIDFLTEGIESLYELQDRGDAGSRSTSLNPTMNIGLQYNPDFYDKISFGLMNTTRFGEYGWTDFRLSANYAPSDIFSASASMGVGSYGTSFGWLLNLHPNYFNFFLGMDYTFTSMAKPGIPLSGNGNFNVGINIPFGGK